MLVSLMLQSGLQLDRSRLSGVLKEYGLLLRAVVANVIAVPLFAFLLVRFMHLEPYIAIGILLMAMAPGVPFLANAAGKRAGGSLSLALTLSFLLPALSIVTVPVTAKLILPADLQAAISFSRLIVTLALFQFVPLLAGSVISARASGLAAKLMRPLAAVVAVCILAMLGMLAPALAKAVATVYGSYGLLAALTVVSFSLGAGWVSGGAHGPYRNTLALATVLRNVALAFVIAADNFGGTPVRAMVAAYFLIQVVVSSIFGRIFAISMRARETAAPAAATDG